ncbi:uncharacterized protein ACRADG_003241 [Cochliomyia hominivorax]
MVRTVIGLFAFWQKPHLPEFLQKFVIFPGKLNTVKKSIPLKELKDNCDEQEIVLQLSRLYVISPERIILLLTQDSIKETCQDIDDILQHINLTITESKPLPVDNLYMKLYSGLVYYNSYACLYNKNIKSQHLHNYHECLIELREDLLDCEGPPDWFEKSNETIVCQYFNDIINCNYIKTALLCGLKPARMLRSFSYKIMNKIVKVSVVKLI